MSSTSKVLVLTVAVVVGGAALGPGEVASALDVNGSWVTNLRDCNKIFVRKGAQTYLSRNADFYGSGFVIDGATIRGKIVTCKITSLKESGQTANINAACATDITISDSQFQLKVVEDNKIVRTFPGIPEMDTPYYRCP